MERTEQKVKIFLKNGFIFGGIELSRDSQFIQILDRKTGKPRFIRLDEISNFEILGVE